MPECSTSIRRIQRRLLLKSGKGSERICENDLEIENRCEGKILPLLKLPGWQLSLNHVTQLVPNQTFQPQLQMSECTQME